MNSRTSTLASAGILGLLLPALFTPGAVAASPGDVGSEPAAADVFVLDETAPGVEHVGDSTFYPLPEGYEDATVVTAEVAADLGVDSVGAISNKEAKALRRSLADNPKVQVSTTEDDAAARLEMSSPLTDASISATAWTSFFVPPGGAYGLWAQRNTAVFPIGDIRQPYTWQMHPASNAQVCGQGIGWYRGYNGGGR